MNSRSRYPPTWMGGGGGMHPNANPNFQQRNQQHQYMQTSSSEQQFQNQKTQQWMRRNELSSDSAVDEFEKTVQSQTVDGRSIFSFPPQSLPRKTLSCIV